MLFQMAVKVEIILLYIEYLKYIFSLKKPLNLQIHNRTKKKRILKYLATPSSNIDAFLVCLISSYFLFATRFKGF